MCLAVPGKITRIEGDVATVDYGAEKRLAKLLQPGFKSGDYVIVKGRAVIEKVGARRAREWLSAIEGKTVTG
jgi:hydrogenase expression/formation protein HypC